MVQTAADRHSAVRHLPGDRRVRDPYGINFIAGPEGFGDKITLKAQMRDAFGLTKGTGVTVRGVDVGTVSKVTVSGDGKRPTSRWCCGAMCVSPRTRTCR